jgi:hypothetical protein
MLSWPAGSTIESQGFITVSSIASGKGGEETMFESLDDQMKHDAKAEKTPKERVVEVVAIVVLSIVVFAGLFFGVRMLE